MAGKERWGETSHMSTAPAGHLRPPIGENGPADRRGQVREAPPREEEQGNIRILVVAKTATNRIVPNNVTGTPPYAQAVERRIRFAKPAPRRTHRLRHAGAGLVANLFLVDGSAPRTQSAHTAVQSNDRYPW
jgi:hypothetical protein